MLKSIAGSFEHGSIITTLVMMMLSTNIITKKNELHAQRPCLGRCDQSKRSLMTMIRISMTVIESL